MEHTKKGERNPGNSNITNNRSVSTPYQLTHAIPVPHVNFPSNSARRIQGQKTDLHKTQL